jgi:hypothetical protein
MNLLEQQLHYPLGETLPDSGQALEVAPGVRWIRMGLPFALNHINLWLLRDEIDGQAGWTIVDCLYRPRRIQSAVGSYFCEPAARPAGAARCRDAHAPRPHRAGALAV